MDPTRGVIPPSLIPGFPTGVDNMGGSSKLDGVGEFESIHRETWEA